MKLIDRAAALTDQADLVIISNVETLRDQSQPVTATAVASLIGGAPVGEMDRRLRRLTTLGLLEVDPGRTPLYWVSAFGVELCRRELIGWSPSQREESRRDLALRRAVEGKLRL